MRNFLLFRVSLKLSFKLFFWYKMKNILFVVLSILLVGISALHTSAWIGLEAEDGDILSFTKWNELIVYINTKLGVENIIAGDNITIDVDGNNLTLQWTPWPITTLTTNRDDSDMTLPRYYGASYSDGTWKIDQETWSATQTQRLTATSENNPSQTNYSNAWIQKESLVYQ